jgi:hypothetical protein
MKNYMKGKLTAPVYKTEINGRGCDNSLSARVGIKIRRTLAVAQSVYFACGLKATEFFSLRVADQS